VFGEIKEEIFRQIDLLNGNIDARDEKKPP
jgi:hypothetical protein